MKRSIALAMIATMLTGVSILGTSPADAQNPCIKGRVNHRQTRQQVRINQGVANGSLTARETARLQSKEARLSATEQRMRASGDGLTLKERAKLEKAQDNLSKDIRHQKHDEQARGD